MKTKITKQINAYKLDLATTNRVGGFLCPQCKTKISPDDHSEIAYALVDINVNSHGLEEIVLNCKRCNSLIHLTGFSKIEKLADLQAAKANKEKVSTSFYINHI